MRSMFYGWMDGMFRSFSIPEMRSWKFGKMILIMVDRNSEVGGTWFENRLVLSTP